jgi:hypothetical protein
VNSRPSNIDEEEGNIARDSEVSVDIKTPPAAATTTNGSRIMPAVLTKTTAIAAAAAVITEREVAHGKGARSEAALRVGTGTETGTGAETGVKAEEGRQQLSHLRNHKKKPFLLVDGKLASLS